MYARKLSEKRLAKADPGFEVTGDARVSPRLKAVGGTWGCFLIKIYQISNTIIIVYIYIYFKCDIF